MIESRLTRLMVALCVALSLVVMPFLSQHATAAHHPVAAEKSAVAMTVGHDALASAHCDNKQESDADNDEANCCDISCSSVVALEMGGSPSFVDSLSEHNQIDADELTSRLAFGLKRPPRV